MFSPDWVRLAALVDEQCPEPPLVRAKGVCELCAAATGTNGVALSIAGTDISDRVISTVCATDGLSLRLEDLQLGLAEGPIVDALDDGRVVLAPDLSDASDRRWLWFARAAVDAGAAAVFVLPLCVGSARVGALSLYRSSPGDLTPEQLDALQLLGSAATSILLSAQAEPSQEPCGWAVGDASGYRPEVHQAVGAIMVHLHVDAGQALARLRAHVFVADQPITEVAEAIVAGRLQLEHDAA